MKSVAKVFGRAVAAHREAVSHVEAGRNAVRDAGAGAPMSEAGAVAIRQAVESMVEQAAALAPGWLGCPLESAALELPTGVDARPDTPMLVRLGTAAPLPGCEFGLVVPFLGAGHLTIDRDGREKNVAGWVRGLLLRAVAALPEGALRVLPVDGGTLGSVFEPFRALVTAEVWRRPAVDLAGLRDVLSEAERRAEAGEPRRGEPPLILVCVAAMPEGAGRAEWSRLAALAHAGPPAGVYLLLAGYPPARQPGTDPAPRLERATHLTAGADDRFRVSDPPGGQRFGPGGDRPPGGERRSGGDGLAVPLDLAADVPPGLVETLCRRLARTARSRTTTDFAALMPERTWTESSATGLRTVVGRDQKGEVTLALDDATPHWLVGGRTGSGKTVFLLDVLYGLASRYSPDELALYLLDFKEGVSFAEFTPTPVDPSWIPHARTVGIESDREYGLAVLNTLVAEMGRRATELKRHGVTKIADLRERQPALAMPRLVAVIDEFHVLFAGKDNVSEQAASRLEELARKGRSYGIHLILASQTISGIEALYNRNDSIFGQFPLRVALAGGRGVLDKTNSAADGLTVGTAVVNAAAGIPAANRLLRFPDADADSVGTQRHLLWAARRPDSPPPAVFAGYADQHLQDDSTYDVLTPDVRRRRALVGRAVDVGLPTVGFTLDGSPGRHLAVLGTSPAAADVLHAAVAGLARQHAPGTADFLLAPLVAVADPAADAAQELIKTAGHACTTITDATELKDHLARLAQESGGTRPAGGTATYLVVFGADAASRALTRAELQNLHTVLIAGPAHGVHLLGWWRSAARFNADLVGGGEVACLVVLNLEATEVRKLVGDFHLSWRPRPNRALMVDRHESHRTLIVPYTRRRDTDENGGAA